MHKNEVNYNVACVKFSFGFIYPTYIPSSCIVVFFMPNLNYLHLDINDIFNICEIYWCCNLKYYSHEFVNTFSRIKK